MENIIKELVLIESRAKSVTEHIQKDKETRRADKLESDQAIRQRVADETKEKIIEIHKQAADETAARIKEIALTTQNKFSEIEVEFEKNSEQWRNEIFQKVVGRCV